MQQIEQDFMTLFNCHWYKDFPVVTGQYTNPANWTAHVGFVVRECGSLLGARTLYEKNGRLDAVMSYPNGQVVSNIEWEWIEAQKDTVNEIRKLHARKDQPLFSTFISYCNAAALESVLEKAQSEWQQADESLLLFIVTFEKDSGDRWFKHLNSYRLSGTRLDLVRTQPALSWERPGAVEARPESIHL
ncbi:hypothetical protein [Pseudomonas sp. 2(2015)]|uniref:hypothetical protein n=1 Tax=Pseudomonas sp. 2(2015) TaxID=1619950 RepID=UPI000696EDB4|nr:hypothetical protein [Pseudomonas sp. 2(2015)]